MIRTPSAIPTEMTTAAVLAPGPVMVRTARHRIGWSRFRQAQEAGDGEAGGETEDDDNRRRGSLRRRRQRAPDRAS